jgi:hypothetical protein
VTVFDSSRRIYMYGPLSIIVSLVSELAPGIQTH